MAVGDEPGVVSGRKIVVKDFELTRGVSRVLPTMELSDDLAVCHALSIGGVGERD